MNMHGRETPERNNTAGREFSKGAISLQSPRLGRKVIGVPLHVYVFPRCVLYCIQRLNIGRVLYSVLKSASAICVHGCKYWCNNHRLAVSTPYVTHAYIAIAKRYSIIDCTQMPVKNKSD